MILGTVGFSYVPGFLGIPRSLKKGFVREERWFLLFGCKSAIIGFIHQPGSRPARHRRLAPQAILDAVWALHPAVQKQILAKLKKRLYPPAPPVLPQITEEIRETRFTRCFACPHCGHEKATRYGTQNGRQRYLCPACAKKSSSTT